MGFKVNGLISFELQNVNVRYWEAKLRVSAGVARSRGKEGLFSGLLRNLWCPPSNLHPKNDVTSKKISSTHFITTTFAFSSNGFFRIARLNRYG